MSEFNLELYLEMMKENSPEYSNDIVERAYRKAFIEHFN